MNITCSCHNSELSHAKSHSGICCTDTHQEPVTCCHKGLIGNDYASRVWKGVPWRNNSKIDSIASFITCACRLQTSVTLNVLTACQMVINRQGKKIRLLSVPEIKRVVKAFADCGTSKIRITGGEPSLRKDFPEIIHTVASTHWHRKSSHHN